MTICLALLSDKGKQVVAVADRMVSVDFLSLEFESRTRKVDVIGKTFAALTAGNALGHTELLRRVSTELSNLSQPTVRDVAHRIESAYEEERHNLAEKTVLRPVGMDYQTFLQNQSALTEDIALGLLGQLQAFEFDLEILLAGVDTSGGHLYVIENPGVATCFDSIGYSAIGSGLPHAESYLTEADYSPEIPLNRAIWLSYVAKKRGERAPGVGKTTDVLVIDGQQGVRFLSAKTLAAFDSLYQQYLGSLRLAEPDMEASIKTYQLDYER